MEASDSEKVAGFLFVLHHVILHRNEQDVLFVIIRNRGFQFL